MTRRTRKPALPTVQTQEPALKRALDGLREQVMRWRGDSAALADELVTKGELTDSGIGQYGPGARGGAGRVIESPDQGERRVDALTNLSAKGVFETVILTWDGTNQRHYSFTEIWRASTDDLGQAVKRGAAIATAAVFRDQADRGQTYYYWVRGVSTSGQAGPFNATSGTQAHTSASPDAVRDAISSTEWQANTSYLPLAVIRPTSQEFKIDGVPVSFQAISGGTSGSTEPDWQASVANLGDTVSDGSVTWEAIDTGQAPLLVGTRNGNPVVVIPGAVIDNASIESAKIADAAITKAKVDNAAVDTSNLAGNAVTIPTANKKSGTVQHWSRTPNDGWSSWVNIISASVDPEGQPVIINGAVKLIAESVRHNNVGSNDVDCSTLAKLQVRLKRGTTVIVDYGTVILAVGTTTSLVADSYNSVPVSWVDQSPGGGSNTYTIEARMRVESTDSECDSKTSEAFAQDPTIQLIGAKR